jgi:uncharacterized FAD-dependent dehydrogenase
MTDSFDVGIIGAGTAGVFAAYKIAKDHPKTSAILFDLGRPCGKRRRPGEGYFGMFPNSDGKLYLNDVDNLANIVGNPRANKAHKWFSAEAKQFIKLPITKDPAPNAKLLAKIKKLGYSVELNNHIQLLPKEIHLLSKITNDVLIDSKNITFSFDNEIYSIAKHKNYFHIDSYMGDFVCKKLIICVGRSGWRWAQAVFNQFGIVENNDVARFGVRVEMEASSLKDMNESHCTISNDSLRLGPFCWNGTVVPEDQIDFAISSFRGNEDRWKTDNVSFDLIGNREFKNNGFEQASRIGQLSFILSNDRVMKEKINAILNKKSKLSILPEYDWLSEAVVEVSKFIPELQDKGYMHFPTIIPMTAKIKLDNRLSTEVSNMFCAGESAGEYGILFSILSGIIAADYAAK